MRRCISTAALTADAADSLVAAQRVKQGTLASHATFVLSLHHS